MSGSTQYSKLKLFIFGSEIAGLLESFLSLLRFSRTRIVALLHSARTGYSFPAKLIADPHNYFQTFL